MKKEMKNAIESIDNRSDQIEEKINDLESKNFEGTETKEQKFKKSKESLYELLDSINNTNLRITRVLEGERERREQRVYLKKKWLKMFQAWERCVNKNP